MVIRVDRNILLSTNRTSSQRRRYPQIQILTIEDLLAGKKIDMPAWRELRTFKHAPKAKKTMGKDAELF